MIEKAKLVELINLAYDATTESELGKKCTGAQCNGSCAATYLNTLQVLFRKEILEKEVWEL